jgi:hypothetical protein
LPPPAAEPDVRFWILDLFSADALAKGDGLGTMSVMQSPEQIGLGRGRLGVKSADSRLNLRIATRRTRNALMPVFPFPDFYSRFRFHFVRTSNYFLKKEKNLR